MFLKTRVAIKINFLLFSLVLTLNGWRVGERKPRRNFCLFIFSFNQSINRASKD